MSCQYCSNGGAVRQGFHGFFAGFAHGFHLLAAGGIDLKSKSHLALFDDEAFDHLQINDAFTLVRVHDVCECFEHDFLGEY